MNAFKVMLKRRSQSPSRLPKLRLASFIGPICSPLIVRQKPREIATEAILPDAPHEVAKDIPVPILPVVDATTDTPADASTSPMDGSISTHTPVAPVVGDVTSAIQPEQTEQPAAPIQVAMAENPAETEAEAPTAEPVVSAVPTEATLTDKMLPTPPVATETNLKAETIAFPSTEPPVKLSSAPVTPMKSAATNGSGTPSNGPTTPIKHRFPTEDGDDGAGSIRSRGSARKKRDSIFGKIKRVFSHHKEGSEHN